MLTIKRSLVNKILVVLLALVILAILLILNPPTLKNASEIGKAEINADGKQLISITAKAGFTPNTFEASGNKSTILRVSTKNTFDCSSTITFPALGLTKVLPFSGETDIELPPQAIGTNLIGTCSMGMYSFTIKFT